MYLYVMCYSNCTIWEIELDKEDLENLEFPEIILDKYDFNESNCEWMFSDKHIDIIKYEN